jgi:biotin carboxylase
MADEQLTGKRALVLGASKWQVPLIRQAQSMGLEVVATDMNPKAVGLKIADYGEVVDILDADANTDVAIKHNVDAVMTDQTDYALNVVAKVASRLVIPGPSVEIAKNCTNKKLMREITSARNIPNPAFHVAESLVDARLAASDIGFPLIIKPTDNQGSRGVFKINNQKQLIDLFADSIKHSRDGQILVEEYIQGTEVTVEGFVADGELHTLAISEKEHTPPPRIIATNLNFPPSFDKKTIEKIKRAASDVASALGMTNGPYHGEFIVNQDGIFLIEAAYRGGGSGTSSHIVPAVSGVNVLEKLVLVSLGYTVEIKPTRNDACILKFLQFKAGHVKNVTGLWKASRVDGVRLFEINYHATEIMPSVTDDSKRHGAIIVSAPTLSEAKRNLDMAVSMVKIIYEAPTVKPEGLKMAGQVRAKSAQ